MITRVCMLCLCCLRDTYVMDIYMFMCVCGDDESSLVARMHTPEEEAFSGVRFRACMRPEQR